jgi:hypothetical protein
MSLRLQNELHIYLEQEIELKKWTQFCLTVQTKTIGLELMINSSFNFCQLGKEYAKHLYFDSDLKTNDMDLWTDNFVGNMH